MEPLIDPDRVILDPHIHLWRRDSTGPYLIDELRRDLGAGHRVDQVIYVECSEAYRRDGPEHLRALGETAHASDCAQKEPRIAGIVVNSDLCQGEALADTLAAHRAIAGNLALCGVRHAATFDPHRTGLDYPGKAPAGLLDDPAYASGVQLLGRLGVASDHLVFFHQLPALAQIARQAPDTVMVINHLGLPLRGGPYREQQEHMRSEWERGLALLAACPNAFLKIGGFSSRDSGFDWWDRDRPPSSDLIAAAWRPWIETSIDIFSPDRCMFESNFPVDRRGFSYRTLWNAFKKVVSEASETEKDALFHKTAARVYGLQSRNDSRASQAKSLS